MNFSFGEPDEACVERIVGLSGMEAFKNVPLFFSFGEGI